MFVDRLVMMDAVTAEEICSLHLDRRFRERFGNPYAVVHRGQLHAIIRRECETSDLVELRTGAE